MFLNIINQALDIYVITLTKILQFHYIKASVILNRSVCGLFGFALQVSTHDCF